MPPKFTHITDTEMAILNVLWDEGRTTIRTITDRLYPEGKPSEYATVKSLLKRLEDKGCVARDRDTTYHIYQATISRNYMIAHKLKEVADVPCEAYPAGEMKHGPIAMLD